MTGSSSTNTDAARRTTSSGCPDQGRNDARRLRTRYPAAHGSTGAGAGYLARGRRPSASAAADSVRLFATDGTTVLDSYTWASHATTTYGRCPDGTGAFTTTQVVDQGRHEQLLPATSWPTLAGWQHGHAPWTWPTPSASNLSGLTYEGTGTTTPGTLWAVRNGARGAVQAGEERPQTGCPTPATGRPASSCATTTAPGNPDAEGVTFTDAGSGGRRVRRHRAGQRRTAASAVRPSCGSTRTRPGTVAERHRTTGTSPATCPGSARTSVSRRIAWVPDSYLTAKGFKTCGGTAYDPADFPNHGTGLFFVGVEQNGIVYAYALDLDQQHLHAGRQLRQRLPGRHGAALREGDAEALGGLRRHLPGPERAVRRRDRRRAPTQGTFVPVTYYERPTRHGEPQQRGVHHHAAQRVRRWREAGLLGRRRRHRRQRAPDRHAELHATRPPRR